MQPWPAKETRKTVDERAFFNLVFVLWAVAEWSDQWKPVADRSIKWIRSNREIQHIKKMKMKLMTWPAGMWSHQNKGSIYLCLIATSDRIIIKTRMQAKGRVQNLMYAFDRPDSANPRLPSPAGHGHLKNGVLGCHPAFSSGQRAITVPPSHILDTLDTLTGALILSPPEPAFQNASLNVYCWVRHHLRLQIHRQPNHKWLSS